MQSEILEYDQQRPGGRIYIILGVLLTYIFQDFFTHKYLYAASENIIITLQRANSKAILVLMQVASDGCSIVIALGMIALFVAYGNRVRVLSFTVCFVTVAYLTNFLKMLYNNPRPFMSFPDVKALECATEYGNPSGHAFLNCFFFVVFPWLYVPQIYTFTEKEQWRWMRIGAAAIIALWITWIALSRMYLGVHSLNQILLGIVYGLLSALLYVQLLAVRLEKFFCDIIFVDRNVRLRWLIISGGVSVACIAVTQGTFSILQHTHPLDVSPQIQYWQRMQVYCEGKLQRSFLYNKCFSHSGVIGIALALILAPLLRSGYGGVSYAHGRFLKNYQQLTLKQKALRVLLVALAAGVAYGPIYLIFKFSDTITQNGGLVPLRFYVQNVLNGFLLGFSLICLAPILLSKFSVDIEGDYFRYDQTNKFQSNSQDEFQPDTANSSQLVMQNLDGRSDVRLDMSSNVHFQTQHTGENELTNEDGDMLRVKLSSSGSHYVINQQRDE